MTRGRHKTPILTADNDSSAVGAVRELYAVHRTWEAVAAYIGTYSAPYWRLVALGERRPSRVALRALRTRLGRLILGQLPHG